MVKVGERDLSCFFCRELFSLYLEDHLDGERTKQLEQHLAKCSACAGLFDKIKTSRKIMLELAKTKPTTSLIEYLHREQHFWTEFFEKVGWKKWPATLKWAVELSVVATVLATTIHFLPWLSFVKSINKENGVSNNQIAQQISNANLLSDSVNTDENNKPVIVMGSPSPKTIAGLAPGDSIEKIIPNSKVNNSPVKEIASEITPPLSKKPTTKKAVVALKKQDVDDEQGDDEVSQNDNADRPGDNDQAQDDEGPGPAQNSETQGAIAQGAIGQLSGAQDSQPKGDEANSGLSNTDASDDAAAKADEAKTTSPEDSSGSSPSRRAGWVWKGTLKVDQLSDDLTEKVTATIQKLGGVKAGQVELGWRRGGQRYYHFILPEENYDKLLRDLNGLGIAELTKQPHPRIIKEGHMRIIMTVEESE